MDGGRSEQRSRGQSSENWSPELGWVSVDFVVLLGVARRARMCFGVDERARHARTRIEDLAVVDVV